MALGRLMEKKNDESSPQAIQKSCGTPHQATLLGNAKLELSKPYPDLDKRSFVRNMPTYSNYKHWGNLLQACIIEER